MVESKEIIQETDEPVLWNHSFQLLLVASGIAALGASLVSPILDTLVGPFGVSPDRIGLVISALFAPAIVLNPIIGLVIDRYRRKPVLVVGLVLFGIAGSLIAFTTDFRTALVLRFLQGCGFSATIPVAVTLISDLYSTETQATAQGFRLASAGLFQFVFPIIGSLLVIFSWRAPFLIYALSLPIALFVYLYFEEENRHNDSRDGKPISLDSSTGLTLLLQQRQIAALVLAHGLVYVPQMGFLTYNSIIIVRALDGKPIHSGVLMAVVSITLAITATQAGRISGFFSNPIAPLFLGNLLLGGGLFMFSSAPNVLVAAFGVVGLGAGIGVLGSLFRSRLGNIAPAENRGVVMTINESVVMISFTFTPIVIGFLTSPLVESVGLVDAVRLVLIAVSVCVATLIPILIGLGFPDDFSSMIPPR
ncbi:hypothetical protein EL22_11625 [Halostagnicola sp. A56]|uniref:MFS transporter n=1 Tax=Halostagnicola sp. A56 TaxID=1495067 RepID=UPI0004A08FDD|nr:MFS transporter [Halostagnicola sp. A56]KDE57512.1 hypothetical protein EL22_11625 [Halostagnicola sp. A56]